MSDSYWIHIYFSLLSKYGLTVGFQHLIVHLEQVNNKYMDYDLKILPPLLR